MFVCVYVCVCIYVYLQFILDIQIASELNKCADMGCHTISLIYQHIYLVPRLSVYQG